jgi:hypothetical protein
LQTHLGDDLALGAIEMGEQDRQPTLVGDFLDGKGDALDAGLVGDLAVLDWHVEIDAQQYALVGQVKIVKGLEGGHRHTRLEFSCNPPYRATVAQGRSIRKKKAPPGKRLCQIAEDA